MSNKPRDDAEDSASDGASKIDPLPEVEYSLHLFRQAQRGDNAALNELFERYYDRVYRIVRIRLGARLRSVLDSYDIVQETFMVAARKILEDFEPRDHASIIQWLARIAERQIHDAADYWDASKRSPGKEVRIDAMPAGADEPHAGFQIAANNAGPSTVVANSELKEIYDACVESLPDEYRELILLREYANASWEQICDELGGPQFDANDPRPREKFCHALLEKYRRAQVKLAGCLRLRLRH